MRLFYKGKDGGSDSTVTGYWLIEWKKFFSVALLCFENGSREAYHSHAFNSISWLLSGKLIEEHLYKENVTYRPIFVGRFEYKPSLLPILTYRHTTHKVSSVGRSWVLTLRGPWKNTWEEYISKEVRFRTLTHGRKEI